MSKEYNYRRIDFKNDVVETSTENNETENNEITNAKYVIFLLQEKMCMRKYQGMEKKQLHKNRKHAFLKDISIMENKLLTYGND